MEVPLKAWDRIMAVNMIRKWQVELVFGGLMWAWPAEECMGSEEAQVGSEWQHRFSLEQLGE